MIENEIGIQSRERAGTDQEICAAKVPQDYAAGGATVKQ
jgi:hypothetical protein